MKLYYSTSSPFVRKVTVLALETGLDALIERVLTNPWGVNQDLLADNPLSKVPTLVTDTGQVIYDSTVICEYLDSLHTSTKLIPASAPARWDVLRLQALANGLMEAVMTRFLERNRDPGLRSADWDAQQRNTVMRTLEYLNAQSQHWASNMHLGLITVGCALGYLEFRFADEPWRAAYPRLAAWYAHFSQRPSMRNTEPKPMPA
ncbi:MAG: glutathione S-transferase N-terminal domain-containing protein [Gammaproteobacteria bacterium]|nr:glutathione S-transferase N-terminal domain-containing protein [Gammaproteobacteria bacterium]